MHHYQAGDQVIGAWQQGGMAHGGTKDSHKCLGALMFFKFKEKDAISVQMQKPEVDWQYL